MGLLERPHSAQELIFAVDDLLVPPKAPLQVLVLRLFSPNSHSNGWPTNVGQDYHTIFRQVYIGL